MFTMGSWWFGVSDVWLGLLYQHVIVALVLLSSGAGAAARGVVERRMRLSKSRESAPR